MGDQPEASAEPCGPLHRQQPCRRPGRGLSWQGQVCTRGCSSTDAWWGPQGLGSKAGASEQASGWGCGPWARLAGLSPPSSPWTLPGEPFSLSSGVWGPEGLRAFSPYWALCPQISGRLGLAASATQVSPPHQPLPASQACPPPSGGIS